MGREVAALAEESDRFTIFAGVDQVKSTELPFPLFDSFDACPNCDCIVDFSTPQALPSLLRYALANDIPAVLATTGYSQKDRTMIQEAANVIPLFVSGNLSRGMQVLLGAVEELAARLSDDFDTEIIEAHHRGKADSPSGTARLLADAVNRGKANPLRVVCGRSGIRQGDELGISSVRAGGIFGEHAVLFASDDEVISLHHSAMSRSCFARGALKAAEFICEQKPGLYTRIPAEY
jgi:4-hydroxy-tetrahydrodipicolinate reductase